MTGQGRPLRFLAAVVGGWVALRVVMLWPQIASVPSLGRAIAPIAAVVDAPATVDQPPKIALAHRAKAAPPTPRIVGTVEAPRRVADPAKVALALLGLMHFGAAQPIDAPPGIIPGLPRAPDPSSQRSRFGASAWLFVRDGSGAAQGLIGGQLGGSQIGTRLTYALGPRVALAGRFSAALDGTGRELSAGLEWRPTALPVRLVAERRFALDGGHGGIALGAVGGFGPRRIGRGLRAEGYGQGGYIVRHGITQGQNEGFADGALRLSHALGAVDKVRFDLGAGAWGAAQRGAARLDVGPSLSAAMPIAQGGARLSLDWRQRVGGRARPGSGLVVTLGTDF